MTKLAQSKFDTWPVFPWTRKSTVKYGGSASPTRIRQINIVCSTICGNVNLFYSSPHHNLLITLYCSCSDVRKVRRKQCTLIYHSAGVRWDVACNVSVTARRMLYKVPHVTKFFHPLHWPTVDTQHYTQHVLWAFTRSTVSCRTFVVALTFI